MIPTRTGNRALIAAAGLGLLGDIAFGDVRPGVNVTLWVTAAAAGWIWARRSSEPGTTAPLWLLIPMVAASAGFAWRGDPMLLFCDVAVIGLCLVMAATPLLRRRGALAFAPVGELVAGAFRSIGAVLSGPFRLVLERARSEETQPRQGQAVALASMRGLLLAVPLLLVFGALLASADAGFESLVRSFVNVPIDELVPHLFRFGFLGFGAAGTLYLALQPLDPELSRGPGPGSLGATEVTSLLVAVNALFVVFVALQVSYLFGGHSLIAATASLTYAEYARRGFFQLIVVCAIALPVLLVLARSVEANADAIRRFNPLARFQVALLLLILASAVNRLWLYVSVYGISLDRFHAAAILLWVGASLGWFGITVLRQRSGFLRGSLVSGAIILGTLHLVNPSAIVARALLHRAEPLSSEDARYLARLGDDAMPAIIASLPGLPELKRTLLTNKLLCIERPAIQHWTEWSLSRASAVSAWPAELSGACQETRWDEH